MLLQSYDYLELHRRYGCRLQIGGNDQWGNITAGLDLIRRVEGGERSVHALTLPLVTDASGAKIGKSTGGGNVWLDPAMTSPYALYQYLLNVDDRDVGTYLRLLTFLPREEVEGSTRRPPSGRRPGPRSARSPSSSRSWCTGLTSWAGCRRPAPRCSGAGRSRTSTSRPSPPRWREAPSTTVGGTAAAARRAARRRRWASPGPTRVGRSRDGGAYLNNRKVTDEAAVPQDGDWLHGRFLVLRRGSKAMAVVERDRG